MDKSSAIFCTLSLLVSLGIAVLAYPAAAVSPEKLALLKTPVSAEEMGDLDLGDFGTVSVLELVGYYVENPPAPVTGGGHKKRFQGC